MRSPIVLPVLACVLSLRALAQAPETGPLVLLLPASTRAMAVGNAWVAGRDEDVIFYNPAQLIGARPGVHLSLARYGSASTLGAMAGVYAAGPLSLTLGWGVQILDFATRPGEAYPFVPAILGTRGTREALSMLATVGGAVTWKNFRGGIAVKYAADRVGTPSISAGGVSSSRYETFLSDFGLSHNLLRGVAALAVQNVGRGWVEGSRRIQVPLQTSLGWTSNAWQPGPFDLAVAAQVTARRGWIAPGGGVELGWGWIEGYSVALRAGVRRPETGSERPFTAGATFNADRFSLDYALQLFDGGRNAHRVTFHWR